MNKTILCGRLTAKPELRETATKKPYCRFTMAVRRDKDTSDFINCIAWNKTGETITKYFDKGNQILVSGRIQTSNYNDKDGNKKTTTDVVIEDFYFLEKKKSDPYQDFADENFLE